MATTKIPWAGRVWPFLKGCDRISDGCDDCYAIRQSHMRAANPNPEISRQFTGLTYRDADGRLGWTGRVNVIREHLDDPLHVIKGDRWFVNSLAGLSVEEKCPTSESPQVKLCLFPALRLRHVSRTSADLIRSGCGVRPAQPLTRASVWMAP